MGKCMQMTRVLTTWQVRRVGVPAAHLLQGVRQAGVVGRREVSERQEHDPTSVVGVVFHHNFELLTSTPLDN